MKRSRLPRNNALVCVSTLINGIVIIRTLIEELTPCPLSVWGIEFVPDPKEAVRAHLLTRTISFGAYRPEGLQVYRRPYDRPSLFPHAAKVRIRQIR